MCQKSLAIHQVCLRRFLCSLPKNLTTHLTHKLYSVAPLETERIDTFSCEFAENLGQSRNWKHAPFYISDPKACKGQWQAQFPKTQPLRLELGCGKGGFIAQEAPANPEYNYIAIDIKNEMLVLAKRKLEAAYAEQQLPLDNVRIMIDDIYAACGNVLLKQTGWDRIYISFCNPWPRGKHKKRRLTHPRQLVQYRMLLERGNTGFKTDDDELFEESLEYFPEAGIPHYDNHP